MSADTSTREMVADDAGLSLVELLVALFVGGMLLTLIASLFVSTMQATAATRDLDLATGRAQALSTSLQTDIRNAAEIVVENIPGGGTLVRARVATGDTGWQCRAWALVDLTTTDADGNPPRRRRRPRGPHPHLRPAHRHADRARPRDDVGRPRRRRRNPRRMPPARRCRPSPSTTAICRGT